MDLRRFLVFFVMLFFVFSINVFSTSKIFDIKNIESLPPDVQGNDYILAYSKYSNNIFIAILKTSGNVKSFYIKEDGIYDEYGNHLNMVYRNYISDKGEWDTWYEVRRHNEYWYNGTLVPYYSNKNVYMDNEIILIGKEHHSNLGVFGGMSTSLLFISLLKPFLRIVPIILIVIVMIFSFYKVCKFFKVVF